MTQSLFPLNDKSHRKLCIKPNTGFSQAYKQHLIPLMVDELVDAATEFPVILVKNAAQGGFTLVALMALEAGSNLYCGGNEYSATYAPRTLRVYPFSLQGNAQDGQMEVCVFNDPALLNDDESASSGHALFDEQGNQTAYLQQQITWLMQHSEQQKITQAFVNLLLEHELLHAQKVDISLGNNQSISFDGIYTIDHKKLEQLDDTTYLSLRKSGALQVIHAMMHSMKQLNRLARLSKQASLGK